ncbi:MAG: phosphoserine phosphatase SerB [Candidatus Eisenbacteria bacterium]|nr:phosphoserine phosphatase SerB [Candidatus Eisenbacteria bacterium]
MTHQLVLVSLSGPDRPGLLGDITATLADAGFRLVDIQQATLLDWLALSILVDVGPGAEPPTRLLRAIGGTALALGLSVDARLIEASEASRLGRRDLWALTILSEGLEVATVSRLARVVGEHQANIVTIHRLAEEDLSAVDFILDVTNTPDLAELKSELLHLSDTTGIDLGLQPEDAFRKSKRLVVFDVDSTLVDGEGIDELAREAGKGEAVAALTRQAMDGNLDFADALRRRVALLEGLSLEGVHRAAERLPLTPGAHQTVEILKELGYRVAAISGGFDLLVEPLRRKLQLDHAYANRLEVSSGLLTGRLIGDLVDGAGKAALLQSIAAEERIPLEQVVGVGDGANDIPMLQAAGLGIAFGRRDKIRRAAQGAIRKQDLSGILYLLGVTGRDLAVLRRRRQA